MTKTHRATIQDVAELSGLSICTASRALRGLPNVSEAAQAKVAAAAAALGYVASAAASRLAGGTTGTVAIIAPTATAWFFALAVEAAEQVFADSGHDTLLISLRNDPAVHTRIFGGLAALSHKVDGVLLLNVDLSQDEIQALNDSTLAVASIGMHNVPWDNVGIDNVEAARTATNHLLELGHRDVAILSDRDTANRSVRTATDRLRGFKSAMAGQALTVDPDRVINAESSIEGGRRAMTKLLDTQPLPTAIFAGCDEAAFGAMAVLHEQGLNVPASISIVGLDEHPMSGFLGLSTVRQPVADQGAFAANLLVERLQQPGSAQEPKHHTLNTTLLARASTAGPLSKGHPMATPSPTDPWSGAKAILFDLDGVLTPTADVHETAWQELFDGYLGGIGSQSPYQGSDYYEHIDGKPRFDGVRDFLASRHITLPEGGLSDDPSLETVHGLGNRKNKVFNDIISSRGVSPYPGSVSFIAAAQARGLRLAVVSSSRNAPAVLQAAGLDNHFTIVVDGQVANAKQLPGKPAPDTYLYAAELLGLPANTCIVVEDAVSGVQAGAAADFHSVIGVNRGAGAQVLLDSGASYVVDDLAELL